MSQSKETSQKEVVQAIVIADYFGDEFKPVTDDTPFELIPLLNVPILEYTLEFLSLSGINETFLFCCKGSKEIKEYIHKGIQEFAPWSLSMSVTVISSETCRSFGDCLRDLDAKGVIRGNFILIEPGTVGKIDLLRYYSKHIETCRQDKNAAITLLFHRAGTGNSYSCKKDEITIATSKNNRILFYQRGSMKKFEIPLEVVTNNSMINIFHNLKDMHVAICSPYVLPLFSDNFDFQSRDDFIRGLLMNEEIMGSTIYLQQVEENEYGAAITNWWRYQTISYNIMDRWLYPLTPDVMVVGGRRSYLYFRNNIYRPQEVHIAKSATLIEDVVIGSKTTIDDGAKIRKSIIGDNVRIGKNVHIENSFVFSNVIIESNVKLKNALISFNCVIKANSVICQGSILGEGVMLPKDSKIEDTLIQARATENTEPSDRISEKAYRIKLDEDDVSESGKETYNKPIYRLRMDDSEEETTDYSSSEGTEDLSYRNSPIPDDTNLFLTEVMDSLARGFEDKLLPDNLILEINSSRYAYNVTLREVNLNVVKAILELPFQKLPCKQATGIQYLNSLRPLLAYSKSILKNYIRNEAAMEDALQAVEEVGSSNSEITDCIVKILEWLYDSDFLSEEIILRWFSKLDDSSRLYNKVKPFITWLQEAEEATSTDDE